MRAIKIFTVFHQSTHHAGYSGYAQFLKYIPNNTVMYPKALIPYRFAKKIMQSLAKGIGHYDTNSVYKEIQVVFHILRFWKTTKIIHYLNGERDIRLAISLFGKSKRTKFIATFHKPPQILEQVVTQPKYLKQLEGAIVVGNNQVQHIQQWLGLKKVIYIPHGVNTDFYQPNYTLRSKTKTTLLLVGQHLRNFELFNATVSKLLSEAPHQYQVHVVLRKEYASKIVQHPSVHVFSGVSDEELRAFYQSAHLLLIPFTEVTACNSVLEAMSCGLPIVTTDVGGNAAYLEGTKNKLLAKTCVDLDYVAAVKQTLVEDERLALSKSSRVKAKTYDWKAVSAQITKYYQSIF